MIQLPEQIARDTMERLSRLMTNHLPGFLAALFILLVAWGIATAAHILLIRIFRGARIDRFLRRSGLASLLPGEGSARATLMAAKGAFWAILTAGSLLALSAFDTRITSPTIEWVLLMVPRFLVGAAILLAGVWISRYLGRGALVWAFNEGVPYPRRIGQAVRVVVIFVAVVVAADFLNFARNVFLASFVLIVGGGMLAGALALGLGGRKAVERYLAGKEPEIPDKLEEAGWKHL